MNQILSFFTFFLFTISSLFAQNGTLYFTDRAGGIGSIGTDGANQAPVLAGELSSDISLYAQAGVVFWCEKQKGNLECISTDGSGWQLVIPNLINPVSTVTDHAGGYIYTLEAGRSRIVRSDHTGMNLLAVVSGINSGGDLTHDPIQNKLYWFGNDKLNAANADGSGQITLASNLLNCTDLHVDATEGFVYWRQSSANADNGVYRATLVAPHTVAKVVNGDVSAFDRAYGKLYYTMTNQANLWQATVGNPATPVVITGGFEGAVAIDVHPTDSLVYFATRRFGEYLHRAKLNQNNSTQTLRRKGVYLPGPVAKDPNSDRMIWVNNNSYIVGDTSGRIMIRVNTTSMPSQMFKRNPEVKYLGMCADWANDRVYYAEDAPVGIRRVKTNGSGDSPLPTSTLGVPACLRYNKQDGRLYWSDRAQNKIMSILPNGADERTVVSGLVNPLGFDFDTAQQMIYFAQISGTIGRVKYDGTGLQTNLITGVNVPISVGVNQQLDEIYYLTSGGNLFKAKKDGSQPTSLASGLGLSMGDLIFVAQTGSTTQQPDAIAAQFMHTQGAATITFEEPQTAEMSIISSNGQVVAQERISNQNTWSHPTNTLTPGLYWLVAMRQAGGMAQFAFVVQ